MRTKTGQKKPTHLKWEQNVLEAKEIFLAQKNRPWAEIARLALEVCEITWGGAKKKIRENPYTLKRFAHEVGINPKTLSNYCAQYHNVLSKAPRSMTKDLTLSDVRCISVDITRDTPPEKVQQLIKKYTSEDSYERKIARYLRHVRGLATNFQKNGAALACSEELVREVLFYSLAIVRAIDRDKKGLTGADYGLAQKYDHNGDSAAVAILGGRK